VIGLEPFVGLERRVFARLGVSVPLAVADEWWLGMPVVLVRTSIGVAF
jgi:hypothetical protein